MASEVEAERHRTELEDMYSRFGWKWVALAYMAGRVLAQGRQLPSVFLQDLTLARTNMEGHLSVNVVASIHIKSQQAYCIGEHQILWKMAW